MQPRHKVIQKITAHHVGLAFLQDAPAPRQYTKSPAERAKIKARRKQKSHK